MGNDTTVYFDKRDMIYLASTYSHPDLAVCEQRFHDASVAAARLLASGQSVFSPIVHGHPLVDHGLPTDWPFWERFACDHLQSCDEVVVLMLDGWRASVGVAAEMRIARDLGRPVRHQRPLGGV
jgi:hypothetical protein